MDVASCLLVIQRGGWRSLRRLDAEGFHARTADQGGFRKTPRRLGRRKQQGHKSAFAGRIAQFHATVMTGDDSIDNGQPETCAMIFCGKEGIQHTGQFIGRKPRSAVVKRQFHHPVFPPFAANADNALFFDSLHGVDKNIVEGAIQEILVAKHAQPLRNMAHKLHAVSAEFFVQKRLRLIEQRVHVHMFATGYARARVVKKVVDGLAQAARLVVYSLQNAA